MLRVFPMLARFRSEVSKIVIHLVLAFAGASFSVALHAYSVIGPALFVFGVAMTALLRAVLPPGAVYLASSNPERIALFGRLSAVCIPGVNALLDVSTYVRPEDEFSVFYRRAALALNDCRTTRDEDWTFVARVLIEVAPILLVDARDTTPGIRHELERILRNRLDFKACFLSPYRETPALLVSLGAKSSHPSGEFFIISPDELVWSLASMPGV